MSHASMLWGIAKDRATGKQAFQQLVLERKMFAAADAIVGGGHIQLEQATQIELGGRRTGSAGYYVDWCRKLADVD